MLEGGRELPGAIHGASRTWAGACGEFHVATRRPLGSTRMRGREVAAWRAAAASTSAAAREGARARSDARIEKRVSNKELSSRSSTTFSWGVGG